MLGTNKFREDPLYKHEKSTCHIACITHQCYLVSKGKPWFATAIGPGILALHEKHRKRLMNRPFTGNAEGVHQGVMKRLATMELTADKPQPSDSSFPTLVCANFDGASVMMGSKSGLATRIQQSFPWVIPIYCVAHKLELGILDGVKVVKYLSEFKAIVKTIYLFYNCSPKRRRELTKIATVLEEDLLQYGAVIKEPAFNLCPCGACISKQQKCR